MITLDPTTTPPTTEGLLDLASRESVIVRLPDGRVFIVTEVDEEDDSLDDFADEIARTRRNKALMALLADRSREPATRTLDQVRESLGLTRS